MLLEHIDYPSLLLRPNAMPAEGKLIMNYAGQGHVDLFTFFSQLTGFGPLTRGLAAAKAVLASGGRAVYLTLTNDHQPRTQREHDLTLGWDRTLKDTSSMRFIGPPGRFTEEGVRKREFCMMSERLVRRHGNDSSLRFSLPCATPGLPGGVAAYAKLLETEARTPLNAAGQGKGPLWITRRLRSHGVVAAGSGMRPAVLTQEQMFAEKELSAKELHASSQLLLRYLDPPLLQTGTHLGHRVSSRVEIRVFGLVQWQPLRLWVSRTGFVRGGSPWWNYSSDNGFSAANRPMWDIAWGPDPKCAPLPSHRAPWVSEERFKRCQTRGRSTAQPAGCCLCLTVADTLDLSHGEKGFATTGTLRKLENIARDAGLEPAQVWRSLDDAMTRYLIEQQRDFAAEARGRTISRWSTPFSFDASFGADGRAWLYDTHLLPTWKRPNHWQQAVVDRANAVGNYGPLLLASAHLIAPGADAVHAALLAKRGASIMSELGAPANRAGGGAAPTGPQLGMPQVLEFLRTQGVASALGFRRAWPNPRWVESATIVDADDVAFARALHAHELLIRSMDALSTEPPRPSLLDTSPPTWDFEGRLWRAANATVAICEDAPRIIESFGS